MAQKRYWIQFVIWVLVGCLGTAAQTLLDPSTGLAPWMQGWLYAGNSGTAVIGLTNGMFHFTTTNHLSEQAGLSRMIGAASGQTGRQGLLLELQLECEIHERAERAGFSLIWIGPDARGIELGFHTNEVFALSDQPLFSRGEAATVDLTGLVQLFLVFEADRYRLFLSDRPILSGPLRDYSQFTGFPDPYEIPNFLFIGDDTGSAAVTAKIGRIILLSAPRLQIKAGPVIEWAAVPGLIYKLERRNGTGEWVPVAVVTATNATCRVVIRPAEPIELYRLRIP